MSNNLLVFCVISFFCMMSCSSSLEMKESGPKRINLRSTEQVEVEKMTLLVSSTGVDTDGNGYVDRFQVATSLFGGESAAPLIADQGEFVFVLYTLPSESEPANPVAIWRRRGGAISKSRNLALFGPTYAFDLNLLEQMTDRQPSVKLNLKGWFDPQNGSPPIPSSAQMRLVALGRQEV